MQAIGNVRAPGAAWLQPAHRLAPAALGAMVWLAMPVDATAESDAWHYQCLGDESVEVEICTTEISIYAEDMELVVYFVHNEGAHAPLVVTADPARLSRVSIQVDDKEPVVSDDCEVDGCIFDKEASKRLHVQFRKGRTARLVAEGRKIDPVAEPPLESEDATSGPSQGNTGEGAPQTLVDRTFTLRGFSAALVPPAR